MPIQRRNYSPWRGSRGFNPRDYPYSRGNRLGRFAMPNWVGGADPAYVPTPYEEGHMNPDWYEWSQEAGEYVDKPGRFGPAVDMDIWRALVDRMNQEVTQPKIKRGYTKKKKRKK